MQKRKTPISLIEGVFHVEQRTDYLWSQIWDLYERGQKGIACERMGRQLLRLWVRCGINGRWPKRFRAGLRTWGKR